MSKIKKRERRYAAILADWKTGKYTVQALCEKYNSHTYTVREITGAPGKKRPKYAPRKKVKVIKVGAKALAKHLATVNRALSKVEKSETPRHDLLKRVCCDLEVAFADARSITFDLIARKATVEIVEKKEVLL